MGLGSRESCEVSSCHRPAFCSKKQGEEARCV